MTAISILLAAVAAVSIVLLAVSGEDCAPPAPSTACAHIDWFERDVDGRLFVPVDVNGDGLIDCSSDLELGA